MKTENQLFNTAPVTDNSSQGWSGNPARPARQPTIALLRRKAALRRMISEVRVPCCSGVRRASGWGLPACRQYREHRALPLRARVSRVAIPGMEFTGLPVLSATWIQGAALDPSRLALNIVRNNASPERRVRPQNAADSSVGSSSSPPATHLRLQRREPTTCGRPVANRLPDHRDEISNNPQSPDYLTSAGRLPRLFFAGQQHLDSADLASRP